MIEKKQSDSRFAIDSEAPRIDQLIQLAALNQVAYDKVLKRLSDEREAHSRKNAEHAN